MRVFLWTEMKMLAVLHVLCSLFEIMQMIYEYGI